MNGDHLARRTVLGGIAALAWGVPARATSGPRLFSWERLQAEALALASRPFQQPEPPPAAAGAVGYDTHNDIQFRADRTLLKGVSGGVRLFPVWQMAPRPVAIAVVERGIEKPIAFSRDLFSGGTGLSIGAEGFSGFRVMTPNGRSDWLAFQGASYFRSAGALDQYGLSMRGLAIDTGLPVPEEFPFFSHFWLEAGPDDGLTIHALLDSPSVAGAWRFVNRRTARGVVQDVEFVARFRRDVARLGLAPCTSMFWYGEGNRSQAIDWRPEIHDSDGLAIRTGQGERIWRPLNNPPTIATSSFIDRNPRGFGLLQRDRAFDHYQDDAVFYERRPNLWVEPIGDWGAGAVMLVELPTAAETADNIVAFWTPAQAPRAGQLLHRTYRLHWTADEPPPTPASRVVDSWRGVAGPPGSPPLAGATRLVAEFAGPALSGLTTGSGVVEHVALSRGTPIHSVAYPVAGTPDHWRLMVDVAEPGATALDLRAFLARGQDALSETLAYQFVSAQHR